MAQSYQKYNGDGATTDFTTNLQYLSRSHVKAFVGGVETAAFTWLSNTQVRFTTAPPVGTENVELRRVTPRDTIIAVFNDGSALFKSDLDAGVLQAIYIVQENWEQAATLFPAGHTLDSHTDGVPGESIAKGTIRVYDVNNKWKAVTAPADGGLLIGDTADSKGIRWLPKGTDGNFLQVLDAAAGKLSWVQGFKNLFTTVGDILYASAIGVASRLGIGADGAVLTSRPGQTPPLKWEVVGFTTGDAKLTLKAAADPGWVMMNDGSIGSATSGATTRANADTEALYTVIWNNVNNTWAPVSGGRGGSAAADFAANKTLTLPRQLGRALAIAGAGAGLTSHVLGEYFGSETGAGQHTHAITDPGHDHPQSVDNGVTAWTRSSGSPGGITNFTLNSGGPFATSLPNAKTMSGTTGISVNTGGTSNGNVPPEAFWNVMIKL